MSEEDTVTVEVYQPNRLLRRKLAGLPCDYCGNLMYHRDITALKAEDRVYPAYMHDRCVTQMLQPEPTQTDVESGGNPTPVAKRKRRKRSIADAKD